MTGNLTAPAVLVSAAQNTSANALTRKDYVDAPRSGQVLQIVTHFNVGAGGGSISDWTNFTSDLAGILPKSANSRLIIEVFANCFVDGMSGNQC